jgi:hypothetical protein
MEEITLQDIVIKIFSEPPKNPCTYNLSVLNSPNITLFQLLMSLLISGARHLYGESVSPNDITNDQFEELKSYMESVGYKIKHNYTLLNENDSDPNILDEHILDEHKPRMINIWFEEFKPIINCHGIPICL